MIQEVKKQIHFQAYIPRGGPRKDLDAPPTVTIIKKNGRIDFPARTLSKLGMEEKFISFYFEPTRKIIGWQIKSSLSEGQKVGRASRWKFVKPTSNGNYHTTIKGIIDSFNGSLTKDKYKKIEIKKYIEQEGILEKGTVYYFVELKEEVV